MKKYILTTLLTTSISYTAISAIESELSKTTPKQSPEPTFISEKLQENLKGIKFGLSAGNNISLGEDGLYNKTSADLSVSYAHKLNDYTTANFKIANLKAPIYLASLKLSKCKLKHLEFLVGNTHTRSGNDKINIPTYTPNIKTIYLDCYKPKYKKGSIAHYQASIKFGSECLNAKINHILNFYTTDLKESKQINSNETDIILSYNKNELESKVIYSILHSNVLRTNQKKPKELSHNIGGMITNQYFDFSMNYNHTTTTLPTERTTNQDQKISNSILFKLPYNVKTKLSTNYYIYKFIKSCNAKNFKQQDAIEFSVSLGMKYSIFESTIVLGFATPHVIDSKNVNVEKPKKRKYYPIASLNISLSKEISL